MNQFDSKICIVSLIGKSQLQKNQGKAWKLNSLISRDFFQYDNESRDDDVNVYLQTYFDQKNRVMYINLESIYDVNSILKIFARNESEADSKSFFDLWEKEQTKYLKYVTLLFTISHIIMISNPSCDFDMSYIRFFRIVDILRNKTLPSIVELLKSLDLNLPKEWIYAGRPCSPRVLFLFENCSKEILNESSSKNNILQKLQHSLEDQIYNSLRKSYVITNISNNSLFAIPANQEFVYIHRPIENAGKSNLNMDNSDFLLEQMDSNINPFLCSAFSDMLKNKDDFLDDEQQFRKFVFEHVSTALNEGFNDNIGRTNNIAPVFELPSRENWEKIFSAMHAVYFHEPLKSQKILSCFNQLKSYIDIDAQFSENRCKKILPNAISLYQENIPGHYAESEHQKRLEKAVQFYRMNARGPMCAAYLKNLEHECFNIWKNGRQLCEAVSLTGHPCMYELHQVPKQRPIVLSVDQTKTESKFFHLRDYNSSSDESEDVRERRRSRKSSIDSKKSDEHELNNRSSLRSKRPIKTHNSNIVTRAASNCGEFQRDRKDPFDLADANYTFYADFLQMEFITKNKIIKYEFPVFKASSKHSKPFSCLNIAKSNAASPCLVSNLSNLNLSQETDKKKTFSLSTTSQDMIKSNSEAQIQSLASNLETSMKISSNANRYSPSTEVYLKHMTHSESPQGILPLFSSWSLVCIGKYSDYNAHTGLSQPGFLANYNYLIPWDILISKGQVSSLLDKKKKNADGGHKDDKKHAKEAGGISLRVYIGMEYECPLGHRFISSGPDRLVKVSSNGTVKDDAYKLLLHDMPLYTACPCRNAKDSTPYMAQMMRVFIATPPGSLKRPLNPNPSPCPIFWPSQPGPLALADNSLWVLRLPYIYMSDAGKPYYRPTDFETLNNCRVLKGMFSIATETS